MSPDKSPGTSPRSDAELEERLGRELAQVADRVLVPPVPSLPTAGAGRLPSPGRWVPLLVAAVAVLVLGGLALVVGRPAATPPPAGPPPSAIEPDTEVEGGVVRTTSPTVPYVVDQRLYVDGTQVPGDWWMVESRGETWLAQRTDGSWWSGGPGRDAGPIEAQLDQPPVLSPDGRYVAYVDLSAGEPRLTGFETLAAGEGFGPAPASLPMTEGGVPLRVRAVTDEGDVVVQGRTAALMWRAQVGDQQTVVDLARTAPDQQFRAATPAGLVVVEGVDADPQSTAAYLADLSGEGRLTTTGDLPLYDDLEVSPGGTWLLRSPPGTLGGEVTSVPTILAQPVDGGPELTLPAPDGFGFAVGTWAWEDDRTLVAVLQDADDADDPGATSRLVRCSVTLGECRDFPAPDASAEPVERTPDAPQDFTARSTLADVVETVLAGDRALLTDQAVVADAEWDLLVEWAADGDGSAGSCRDNGSGTQDCEIAFDAAPEVTYYAILEPDDSAYGWRISYVSIAAEG